MEVNNTIDRITGIDPKYVNNHFRGNAHSPSISEVKFDDALNSIEPLKFSGHAINRLVQRGITLTKTQLERLGNAIESANSKGSRDSLVLLNDMAFVVSVKDRTVITALQTAQSGESIFTNIDSTVIA